MIKNNPTDLQNFIHEKTGLEFVQIPAGAFLFGREPYQQKRHLPTYWISKTAVTQAVYHRYIQENPNADVPFGSLDKFAPYNWNPQDRTPPQDKLEHPVVLVTWFDAVAFCEWADVQLPTVEEWEKAARGTAGFIYPWGNEWRDHHANTRKAGIHATTPVGQFSPQGDSPFGCVDMVGNVWEWCFTEYDDTQEFITDFSSLPRMLRGGCASTHESGTRTDYWHPDDREAKNEGYGFRVVIRS